MLGVLERKCRLDKERNIQFYQNSLAGGEKVARLGWMGLWAVVEESAVETFLEEFLWPPAAMQRFLARFSN